MPSAFDNLRIGVVIEGLEPIFGFGAVTDEITTWASDTSRQHTWHQCMTKLPGSVTTSVDPLTNSIRLPSLDLEFSATATVQTTLMARAFDAVATLDAKIGDGGSISGNETPTLSDGIYYIGYETFELNSGGVDERGIRSSTGAVHQEGTKIYDSHTGLRGRRAKLLVFDGSGTPETYWRGIAIDADPADGGEYVRVRFRELWAAVRGQKLGRNAIELRDHDATFRKDADLGPRVTGLQNDPADFPLVHKDGAGGANIVQADDMLVAFGARGDGRPILPSDDIEASDEPEQVEKLFDVFAVGRHFDEVEELQFESPQPIAPVGSLVDGNGVYVDDYNHPLAILAAFCLSTDDPTGDATDFDVLQPEWSLEALNLFEPEMITTLRDLIDEKPHIEVDHFVAGWDGEPLDVWNRLTDMLAAYNYFLAVTHTGKLTVRRLRLATVEDFDNAPVVDPLHRPLEMKFTPAVQNAVDAVALEIGKLPWRDGITRTVTADEGRPGRSRLGTEDEFTIDYSTKHKRNADDAVIESLKTAKFVAMGLPRLTIRSNDIRIFANPPAVGDFVRIESTRTIDGVIVDEDGEVVDADLSDIDEERLVGLVVERSIHFNDALSYRLTLLLTNFRSALARKRAPSVAIDGHTDSGATLTRHTDQFSHPTGDDADPLEVGDEIEVYGADGVRLTTEAHEVTAIGSGGIAIQPSLTATEQTNVDNALTDSDFAVIRLADYDDQIVERDGFTYLADTNEQLGTANDGAHPYS